MIWNWKKHGSGYNFEYLVILFYTFSHDGEDLAPVMFCSGDGCFVKEYNYEASDEQIGALKAISENCYQGKILLVMLHFPHFFFMKIFIMGVKWLL